jgi:hypothetical protein
MESASTHYASFRVNHNDYWNVRFNPPKASRDVWIDLLDRRRSKLFRCDSVDLSI